MKVVILAGGLGSRLAEETDVRPKPMVEVGGKPMIWHIMKYYAEFGFREFVIALGYKGDQIKRYFLEYSSLSRDCSIKLIDGSVEQHDVCDDDWNVHLYDTGLETMTGGRMRRLAHAIGRETFMMTYGDGLANIDLHQLVAFHKSHGKRATVTAVRPPSRFGGLILEESKIIKFEEKPQIGEGWISGGFFVLEPEVFDYLTDDSTVWEREPLERLAGEGNILAYSHSGFWQCMDTTRDRRFLQEVWESGVAPWKIWK